jgi:hypothetical protein
VYASLRDITRFDGSIVDLHWQADPRRRRIKLPSRSRVFAARASLHTTAVVMGRYGGGVRQQLEGGASGGKDRNNDRIIASLSPAFVSDCRNHAHILAGVIHG